MFNGHYINLSKDSYRRSQLEANLKELGLTEFIKRFQATPWNGKAPNGITAPEYGTNLSHLELIANQHDDFGLIFEDDVKLTPHFPNVIRLLPRSLYEQNDLVFFGYGINAFDFQLIKRLLDVVNTSEHDLYFPGEKVSNLQVLDCKFFFRHGLHAYVLNKNSVQKILDLHDQQMATGCGLPLDLILRKGFCEGHLKGAVVFPPVVELDLEKVSNCVERDTQNGTVFHERMANVFVKKYCSHTVSNRTPEMLHNEQSDRANLIVDILRDMLIPANAK